MSMTESDGASSVLIKSSCLHGDGAYANSSLKEGDVVFCEKANIFLQSLENRRDVITCGCCNNIVGSDDFQISLLVGDTSRERIVESSINDVFLSCRKSCGEFYCSETCLNAHWSDSHCLLCTGNVQEKDYETSPLIRFKMHAVATNEIFLLVATLYASFCLKIASGLPVDDVLAPYELFVRSPWWDVAVTPKERDDAEFQNILKDLVNDSWDLLCDVLYLKERGLVHRLSADYMSRTIGMFEQNNVGVRLAHPLSKVLEDILMGSPTAARNDVEKWIRVVEQIIGQSEGEEEDCNSDSNIEANEDTKDLDESVGGDADDSVSERDESPTKRSRVNDSSVGLDRLQELIEDAGGIDEIFPPLDGTAFYLTICKINHSCEPNAIVRYDSSPTLGLHAKLCAIRPIEKGDELVQSYIDQTLGYSSRQEALRDYGFVCRCYKCLMEQSI